MKITAYDNLNRCREIWEKVWPVKGIFDLWAVRASFHDCFSRPLLFLLAEKKNTILGFLPLSWDEDNNCYIQFPGETWQGTTWLEQNQILAENREIFEAMLDSVPGPVHLRYLTWSPLLESLNAPQDELNYRFFPSNFDFSMEKYWLCFSNKSRKKIKSELTELNNRQVKFRFNDLNDIGHMLNMNIASFSDSSYFSDTRFYNAFKNLAFYLSKKKMLRLTTVLIDNTVAAIDMGAVFKNQYTLIAGGTNPEFPGIAKFINLHHIEWSCIKKFKYVDFLCGDFNWKKRFHLSPVPLYEIKTHKNMQPGDYFIEERDVLYA